MKFEIEDNWRDTTIYEYRSPDGNSYVTIKKEVMDQPFVLDAVASAKVDLLKRGLSEAAATPITHCKLGKYEARQGDIRFLDGDDNPVIMRVIVAQPAATVSVSITCRAKKAVWPGSEKVIDNLARSFSFEGDKLVRD